MKQTCYEYVSVPKAIGSRIEPGEPLAQKMFESRAVIQEHKPMNQAAKMEMIRLVEQSDLSVKATLRTLGMACASFFR